MRIGTARRGEALLSLALGAGAYQAHGQIAFEDVSARAGFRSSASETWGASWGDYNGDLYPDLFSNNHRTRATLHRNNRDGTFTEVSEQGRCLLDPRRIEELSRVGERLTQGGSPHRQQMEPQWTA